MNHGRDYGYEDIVRLPHHVSVRHPQMPLPDRAAQFSPFAALTGYEAAIQETARLTDAFIELDEDRKEQLNERLMLIRDNQSLNPEVEITYFQPDFKKSGGAYVTARGKVKRIDEYGRQILLTDGTVVAMDKLYSVDIYRLSTVNAR